MKLFSIVICFCAALAAQDNPAPPEAKAPVAVPAAKGAAAAPTTPKPLTAAEEIASAREQINLVVSEATLANTKLTAANAQITALQQELKTMGERIKYAESLKGKQDSHIAPGCDLTTIQGWQCPPPTPAATAPAAATPPAAPAPKK